MQLHGLESEFVYEEVYCSCVCVCLGIVSLVVLFCSCISVFLLFEGSNNRKKNGILYIEVILWLIIED